MGNDEIVDFFLFLIPKKYAETVFSFLFFKIKTYLSANSDKNF